VNQDVLDFGGRRRHGERRLLNLCLSKQNGANWWDSGCNEIDRWPRPLMVGWPKVFPWGLGRPKVFPWGQGRLEDPFSKFPDKNLAKIRPARACTHFGRPRPHGKTVGQPTTPSPMGTHFPQPRSPFVCIQTTCSNITSMGSFCRVSGSMGSFCGVSGSEFELSESESEFELSELSSSASSGTSARTSGRLFRPPGGSMCIASNGTSAELAAASSSSSRRRFGFGASSSSSARRTGRIGNLRLASCSLLESESCSVVISRSLLSNSSFCFGAASATASARTPGESAPIAACIGYGHTGSSDFLVKR
jgi:hypothetical protein